MIAQRAISIVEADVARRAAANAADTRTVYQTFGPKLAASVNTAITSAAVRGGGVQQAVPKKASSVSPALVVGGLVAVGLVAFLVVRKMKKKK